MCHNYYYYYYYYYVFDLISSFFIHSYCLLIKGLPDALVTGQLDPGEKAILSTIMARFRVMLRQSESSTSHVNDDDEDAELARKNDKPKLKGSVYPKIR
jgi:hypothetical protein